MQGGVIEYSDYNGRDDKGHVYNVSTSETILCVCDAVDCQGIHHLSHVP
jgi:hypothetical protein